ncbi:hypothetical protein EOT10_03965 [Streptomyces antnestii]|uniref:Peptidyl-prolyl cis-trans isomerase n=1 Tax=Streptomyces antnestii TaxID=2494256 RepID=A0A3S2VLY5_9ACTN|nr:hypothetical protein EOT10_03965 [Streptomyces sp. San01]
MLAGGRRHASKLSKVHVPDGDAPTGLTIRDLVIGDGTEVKPGMVVRVHYVGVTFESGKEFDAFWDRGQPFKFTLGSGSWSLRS